MKEGVMNRLGIYSTRFYDEQVLKETDNAIRL